MKFVPKGPINNIQALVQIMAWRRPGDKPLSEPMMVSLTTHICVTRPQWVKRVRLAFSHLQYQTHAEFSLLTSLYLLKYSYLARTYNDICQSKEWPSSHVDISSHTENYIVIVQTCFVCIQVYAHIVMRSKMSHRKHFIGIQVQNNWPANEDFMKQHNDFFNSVVLPSCQQRINSCLLIHMLWSAAIRLFWLRHLVWQFYLLPISHSCVSYETFVPFNMSINQLIRSSTNSDGWLYIIQNMITSSNGIIFSVTGPSSGEFTSHRWIPLTKVSDAVLDVFYDMRLNKLLRNNRDAGDSRRHRAHNDMTSLKRYASIYLFIKTSGYEIYIGFYLWKMWKLCLHLIYCEQLSTLSHHLIEWDFDWTAFVVRMQLHTPVKYNTISTEVTTLQCPYQQILTEIYLCVRYDVDFCWQSAWCGGSK